MTVILKIGAWIIKGKSLDNIYLYFEENGWINLFWSCNKWIGRTNWLGDELINSGPALIPMWYLRDLIVFFVLSPVIYWCIKRVKVSFLIVLFFCYLTDIWPQIQGLSSSMVFFVLGAYLAVNDKNIISEVYKRRNKFYIITFILLPLMIYYDGRYTSIGNLIYPFFVFTLVPVYISVGISLMLKNKINLMLQLSQSSFFIFALHTMILGYCASIIKLIIPSDFWILASMRYLLTPLFCVLVCYACYNIMKRIVPNCLSTLIGGRL